MKHAQILLRKTKPSDLGMLYKFQCDQDANYLAAFTSDDPNDRQLFLKKFSDIIKNPDINMKSIYLRRLLVGSISKFYMQTEAEITYWVRRDFWGQGIATAALQKFLSEGLTRPIFGRVAADHIASQRVLIKAGFYEIGRDQAFANARQKIVEEIIYRLDN